METKEKLKLANKLSTDISELEDFIDLLKKGGEMYRGGEDKINNFQRLSVCIDLWTGSLSSAYERAIRNGEIIYRCKDILISVLAEELDNLKKEFEQLFSFIKQ
jgi:hypothetical protein